MHASYPPSRQPTNLRMAKAKKQNKNSKPKARGRTRRMANDGLDQAARNYRNLLLDPCNAPMCQPTYAGSSFGNYRRFRRIITTTTEVNGVYVFQLGTNTWCSAANASASVDLTLSAAKELFEDHYGSTDDIRCVAGCVKVRYTGAESSRAGVVGLITGSTFCGPGRATGNTAFLQGYAPVINRLGEVQHEAKFVPNTGDQELTRATHNVAAVVQPFWDDSKSTIAIVYSGIPAGTLQIEITGILEAESFAYGVSSSIAPASRNTLNHVLSSLGSVSQWAFGHVVAPVLRATAGAAMNTISSSAAAYSSNMRLLTL